MKVLHVATAFKPAVVYGGPTVVAAQQTSTLAGLGHDVTVVSSNVMALKPPDFMKPGATEMDGVTVRHFASRSLRPHFSFVVSGELAAWLWENVEDFDVVHVHFAREWIPIRAARISLDRGVPTFLHPHGMLGRADGVRGAIDRLWTRRLLERADGVLVFQRQEEAQIHEITPRARTILLPNGVTPPDFGRRWSADAADPVVLFLARLHPRKRVLAFVEMAKVLVDRGVTARYRIVGPDGGDRTRAERLVRERGLGDRVEFVGGVEGEAVVEEYLGSAVYVLPAVNEPFGMTILEAMRLGVPTVITDGCYLAPMLEESGAVLVSEPEPEALASSVEKLLRNPELAGLASNAGMRLVEEEFALGRVAERLERCYADARAS